MLFLSFGIKTLTATKLNLTGSFRSICIKNNATLLIMIQRTAHQD